MKCFYHEERDAVATCTRCNKGLCKECASLYSPCMCEECASITQEKVIDSMDLKRKNALIDTTSEFIFALVKGIVAVLIGHFVLGLIYGDSVKFSHALFFFFIPFGWAVITYLEQFFPVIIFNGIFFIIYFAIKFVLSILFGIPCFLYQVLKFVIGFIINRK